MVVSLICVGGVRGRGDGGQSWSMAGTTYALLYYDAYVWLVDELIGSYHLGWWRDYGIMGVDASGVHL